MSFLRAPAKWNVLPYTKGWHDAMVPSPSMDADLCEALVAHDVVLGGSSRRRPHGSHTPSDSKSATGHSSPLARSILALVTAKGNLNLRHQIIELIGLLDETCQSLTNKPLGGGLFAIAAGQDHADIRADTSQFAESFRSVQVGHGQIQEHAAHLALMLAENLDSLPSTAGCQHREPDTFDHSPRRNADRLVVVHNQNRTAIAPIAVAGSLRTAAAAGPLAGKSTRKVVPLPGALNTWIAPLWPRTMP